MTMFIKEIRFEPGYDHRDDPDKKKYSCHGMNIRFLIHGPKATIQFLLYTGWLPQKGLDGMSGPAILKAHEPIPADLGYHADEAQFEGQQSMDVCEFRPGGTCYYDGSSLHAYGIYEILINTGESGVWRALEEFYEARFAETK